MYQLLPTFFLILEVALHAKSQIRVPTWNGIVEGRQEYSLRGNSFYAFQNIPYAKPPIGDLRFREPQPAENWLRIRDATKDGNICYQQNNYLNLPESEDCLYLNVYTPKRPSPIDSHAVMVYIHGGGFVIGGASFSVFGPHYLMEDNIIVVTVAYRLGPFGFISTGDTTIPGNYGLKDQHLALKWVQKNIKFFGGDPTKVTLNGQSAGGASIGYHLMNPKTAGLINGAILHSASSLCKWNYQRNFKSIAYQLAVNIDPNFNPNASSQELLNFLRNVDAVTLNNASRSFPQKYYDDQIVQGFLFTPNWEPEHESAFVTKRQYGAIENGEMLRVPILLGILSEEMLWDGAVRSQNWDKNISSVVNDNMHITNETEKQIVGTKIRQVYTDGLFSDHFGQAIEFLSDQEFGLPVITHAKLQSKYSSIRFYRFSYYGTIPGERPYIEGAYKPMHGDDNFYIWVSKNNSNLNSYPASDITASERYRTLITNFVKTLNPISSNTDLLGIDSWPPVTTSSFPFLDLNNTITIQSNLKKEKIDKLVAIYSEHAIKPYDTY